MSSTNIREARSKFKFPNLTKKELIKGLEKESNLVENSFFAGVIELKESSNIN